MTDVIVLIPTYNEAENIRPITEAVLKQGDRFGALIIDDNSPDGTGEIADEMAAAEPRISVLHRTAKEGLGPAYLAGFAHLLETTEAEFFITMDADFSHNPDDLPRLVARAEQGADMVVGSRYVKGGGTVNWGLLRKAISRGGGIYARILLRGGVSHDPTGGFNLYRRRALEKVVAAGVSSSGYGFQIETKRTVTRNGLTLAEAPIIFIDRRVGQSKMSPSIAIEAFWQVIKMVLAGK